MEKTDKLTTASLDTMHYPVVTETDTSYSITDRIGAVKHYIHQKAFEVPVRFVFAPRSAGTKIALSIKVFGKNLK